jgi:hypothetical protein
MQIGAVERGVVTRAPPVEPGFQLRDRDRIVRVPEAHCVVVAGAGASWRPSGENATASTRPVWPVRGGGGLAGGGVPEPHRAVVAGAGGLASVG